MSLRLRIDVDARQDFDGAADWYEEKQAGLGLEFIDEMNSVVELVLERPQLGAHVPYLDAALDVRWRLAPRFPYAVFYRIEPRRNPSIRVCTSESRACVLDEALGVVAAQSKMAAPLASKRRQVAGLKRGFLTRCVPHRHSAQLFTRPATAIFPIGRLASVLGDSLPRAHGGDMPFAAFPQHNRTTDRYRPA